ncbi:hypothetical protein KP003_10805 [Geomonas nitrogeniifigens]|uniref:ABC-three component system middle component 1 n=1 Tax=Geomonas diazotrophica TaxID=2843197 RepID=UPI001C2C786F|nr:ABC-three component system middle component 1 [Geomonas nitrogeniifigens]QXE84897.1 hypothetical protein KP003_10805 [Geomonas nitrogeniifigens]
MLIEVVKLIFLENGYVERPVELNTQFTYFFVVPKPELQKQEYFLVLEKKDTTATDIAELVKEKADLYFDTIRRCDKVDESFEKNCTIILCCESSKIDLNSILRFEEDPYNFKKNAIEYRDEELVSWRSHVSGALTVENLNHLVNPDQGASFIAFKTTNKLDYYSLLMKIFIKIPLVYYEPQSTSALYDISDKIRDCLNKEYAAQYDYLIAADCDLTDDVEVENLLLSKWTAK